MTCDHLLTRIHPLIEMVQRKKVEPFYNPWCSIYYADYPWCEHYINFNNTNHVLPSGMFLFTLSPLDMYDDEQRCDLMENTLTNIENNYFKPGMIIFKLNNQYISRINMKISKTIYLDKTRKHFLCVEYIHPSMESHLYLDIDPGYYMKGNEILSYLFVERLLKYQSLSYVFDGRYKLNIIDCMMRTVEINSDKYILLDKDDYAVMDVKNPESVAKK